MKIRDILKLAPVIPVLTLERHEHALPLAKSLVAGGLQVLEITLRTPIALDAIRAIRDGLPEAIVGAGTLVRSSDFQTASKAGAQFGISPGLTQTLVDASKDVDIPLLPGVMTPSELMTAHEWGFDTLKLFPAEQAGGIAMLKALAGPFPDILFCPTGGITPDNASSYLALSNVACVGGSWLAPRARLEAGDWTGIETLARTASVLKSRR